VTIGKSVRSLTSLAALLGLAAHASDAYARVDLNMVVHHTDPPTPAFPFETSYTAIERWSADGGQKLLTYQPNDSFHESIDALSAGPNGRLYAAANNIGQIQILRFSMVTGREIDPPFSIFATFDGGPVGDMQHSPAGGLYVGGTAGSPTFSGAVVRRVDLGNGSIKETLIGNDRTIHSIDFSPDGLFIHVLHGPLFVAPQRLSTYSLLTFFPPQNPFPFPLPFPLPPPSPPVETSGFFLGQAAYQMARGPDGLFYVSDQTANAVLRYTLAGQLVDQFIDQYTLDLNFIEGRQLGRSADNRILEFDPLTGDTIRTLIDGPNTGPGSLFLADVTAVADIPEPAAATLAGFALAPVAIRRHTFSKSR
jgi:hypothetical protein